MKSNHIIAQLRFLSTQKILFANINFSTLSCMYGYTYATLIRMQKDKNIVHNKKSVVEIKSLKLFSA